MQRSTQRIGLFGFLSHFGDNIDCKQKRKVTAKTVKYVCARGQSAECIGCKARSYFQVGSFRVQTEDALETNCLPNCS